MPKLLANVNLKTGNWKLQHHHRKKMLHTFEHLLISIVPKSFHIQYVRFAKFKHTSAYLKSNLAFFSCSEQKESLLLRYLTLWHKLIWKLSAGQFSSKLRTFVHSQVQVLKIILFHVLAHIVQWIQRRTINLLEDHVVRARTRRVTVTVAKHRVLLCFMGRSCHLFQRISMLVC